MGERDPSTFDTIRETMSDIVPCYKPESGGCLLAEDDESCGDAGGCIILRAYLTGRKDEKEEPG